MKLRTIIIGAAGAILAAGWLIRADQDAECRVTSHSVTEENGTDKVIGSSNCEAGTVLLVLEGIPFEVTVKNGVFGAWVEYQDGSPVSVTDARG